MNNNFLKFKIIILLLFKTLRIEINTNKSSLKMIYILNWIKSVFNIYIEINSLKIIN